MCLGALLEKEKKGGNSENGPVCKGQLDPWNHLMEDVNQPLSSDIPMRAEALTHVHRCNVSLKERKGELLELGVASLIPAFMRLSQGYSHPQPLQAPV